MNETTMMKVNVLMIGTGEYTTGYVGGTAADSDKGSGVVALAMFDLKRRNKVNRIGMCGVNGTKFPGIREHMRRHICNVYTNMDYIDEMQTYPDDVTIDPKAYIQAISTYNAGDVAILFTPDDTHYDIAMACVQHGMHVMITKPIVQTLQQHQSLANAAKQYNVLVAVEVHKRFDPFYADARDRIRANMLGESFQYMYAYMSQPKHQLETFRAWAGKSSDISYYLNSHHVDWTEWTLAGRARPVRVTATASTGVAAAKGIQTEDSITLTVQWENYNNINNNNSNNKTLGCAVYTSSWVAPKSDVHSQQRFFYMGSAGEINVDQAHRGCSMSTDTTGHVQSINPLFMKYTPNSSDGTFAGQNTYGIKSFETFIDSCRSIQSQTTQPSHYDNGIIATVHTTKLGTAILEAGRRSLDQNGCPMDILYDTNTNQHDEPIDIVPHVF